MMYLITKVIKLHSPSGAASLCYLNSYQQTEQSDDALVGDPHHEGRVLRGEAPLRGREVLAHTVRGTYRQLTG